MMARLATPRCQRLLHPVMYRRWRKRCQAIWPTNDRGQR